MTKKIQFRDIIIGILIILLVFNFLDTKPEKEEDDKIEIVIPEDKGSSEIQIIEKIKTDTVYINKEKVIVDTEYKKLYQEATDSISKLNIFLEAIAIKEYKIDFIKNDTIEIKGDLKTRGDLLEYKIDWTVKEKKHIYEPKTIVKNPRLSLLVGVEAGIPTTPNTKLVSKAGVDFINEKGSGLGIGYDTEQRVWFKISRNLILRK